MPKREEIVAAYNATGSTYATAEKFGMAETAVRKILYDTNTLPISEEGQHARDLYARGFSVKAIMDLTHKSRTWVYMMLPAKGRPHKSWSEEEKKAVLDGDMTASATRSMNAVKIQKSRLLNKDSAPKEPSKLATARKKAKYSQTSAAKSIGVWQKDICRWETGAVTPSVEVLKKLADLYGCTVDSLI